MASILVITNLVWALSCWHLWRMMRVEREAKERANDFVARARMRAFPKDTEGQ